VDDIETAIVGFRDAAIRKGAFGGDDDHAHYSRMRTAFRNLQDHGSDGMVAFREDPDPNVRTWVASQLLANGDLEMIPILEELSRDTGMVGFNAEMALREFRNGSLRPPLGTDLA
jgi:hypothetical protein